MTQVNNTPQEQPKQPTEQELQWNEEKELQMQELAEDLGTVTAAILSTKAFDFSTDAEKIQFADTLLMQIQERLMLSEKQLKDAAIVSTIELLEQAASLTPSKADDKLVDAARALYNFFSVKSPFLNWIKKIKQRVHTRRAARKARRYAKKNA